MIKLSKKQRSYKKKQLEMKVNTENPLIDINNVNPEITTDMKIEVANENQSTDILPSNKLDKNFELMISKSKRKQKKRKQKL
jgi:hypothetical protein